MKRLNNYGDTIVEVLLAMVIVSAVLGGAFVSSNRSLNAARQSQERGEALKFVEGQLELLKAAGKRGSDQVYSASPVFCFTATAPANTYTTAAPCQNSSLGVAYGLSITRAGNTFTVLADWDRAGGGGREQLDIVYIMHPVMP